MKVFEEPHLYNMERFMLTLFLFILIAMVKTSSTASQDIWKQLKSLVNQKKKIKRTKSSVQYYSNHFATYRIISGDIKINPGPGLHKPKCQVCDKTVLCNQKHLGCEHCLEISHVKMSNAPIINQNKMLQIKLTNGPAWIVFILHFHSTTGEI